MPDGSLLTIEWVTKWGAGFKIIYLAKGTASLRLAPGNYTIRLEEKKNWPQLYKEKTMKLHVEPESSYTVEPPTLHPHNHRRHNNTTSNPRRTSNNNGRSKKTRPNLENI